jgi:hypothetical protein
MVEQVSAVIVTRGNRDLTYLLEGSLRYCGEVIVWDNSKEAEDAKVYGRYLAIQRAKFPLIYTQDDDCEVPVGQIVLEHAPGKLVCNMKPGHHEAYRGTGIALVGHGAVFEKSLVDFSPYFAKFPKDELFLRECDRVFTFLNRERFKWVRLPISDLPHASEAGAMWKEERNGKDLQEIKRRLQIVAQQ